ncbi:hypothetical protein AOL_s00109g101 [Orbilia oligospora ATCC 24927]|uniref:Uncharacterized protein n=1 Tax=Arthrobotrys oligospora (strain ATCC 24927 / CBS 115.81 / DSM 1491) TaxID=756982 RepID=G1XK72_ARTOA|nr:hypothetical protein AOL_s00109g101 [Orbilia oligospora ATCC 24927]EGX46529.1 hypothetical protein AOL_s00109g101 [Orbilia oligospora ATCC 24927]
MSSSDLGSSDQESDSHKPHTLSLDNHCLGIDEAQLLVQGQIQDAYFNYCQEWDSFVALLGSLHSKPRLYHLIIVASEEDLPSLRIFLELLEPGLETLCLLVDFTHGEFSEYRYPISNELILKHSSTLRHFGILERTGPSADEASIVIGGDDFSFIKPILEACNLKELSMPVDVEIRDGDDCIVGGDFDGLPLDNLETLYLVPEVWPSVVWSMGCDGRWRYPRMEFVLANFLRNVIGIRPNRPNLKYICLGGNADHNPDEFTYGIKWRRNRLVGRKTVWYPILEEVSFGKLNKKLWPAFFSGEA